MSPNPAPLQTCSLARSLGISEDGAASLVSQLARERKVRICLVTARD
jgi:hypothetical protein